MASAALEIQDAVIARLRSDPGVTALVGQRSWDRAPQASAVFPLIELGARFIEPWDADDMAGQEMFLTVNVWSEKPGGVEATEIAGAVRAALHDQPLTLASRQMVLGRLQTANVIPRDDGITTQAAMRFRFLTHD